MAKPVDSELHLLLEDICRAWGFCLPREARERIAGIANLDRRTFAIEVLHAEGFKPEYQNTWMRRLMERFERQFGASAILNSTAASAETSASLPREE